MKILHVNKFFDFQGGAEVYMHGLMRYQEALGHEVHAFSTHSIKNLPSKDERFFVKRYDLKKKTDLYTQAKIAANFIWNVEAKKALGKMLDEVKPDIIHIHNIYHHLSTSVLAEIRKRKIPCVQTLHDYKLASPNYSMFAHGTICEHSKGGRYYEVVKYKCLSDSTIRNVLAAVEMYMTKTVQSYERTIALFLCPSQFMKEKMIDWGEPASKMRLVRNPTDRVEVAAVRGGGYLIYAGRLSEEKGLESFLEAACLFPSLPVKLAGSGPDEAKLRAIVEKHGASHIEFLGFVDPVTLRELRHRAEALVLPTLSYENCSGSILEAMASGLPCLVTRTGGNPELIEDGKQGFLVTPGSVEDWTRALHRFLATPTEVRDAMGQSGREKVAARHDWHAHTLQVLSCYEEAGAK
ncbi:MAG: glycosyltransferase family 4 protein [Candidatus Magasanikbacteria bacterium]|nr:glycosyltransferase family 4 protein [Candidatus Magasanikbacteria bacterium]MCA9389561.1 glycosyltransferase family 4 protein [Candidatus Magasanikbacteria bacterium]MCA9390865.1 glycosyltransferase family 4 protein [Candidatus Magasanikbacteria bacterium]HPF95282.1 glycosyltransferase family 4 protein [bacterium]